MDGAVGMVFTLLTLAWDFQRGCRTSPQITVLAKTAPDPAQIGKPIPLALCPAPDPLGDQRGAATRPLKDLVALLF
jgi:hypothetical protein